MRAHIVRSRGQVAVHSRTPALAARMPPAVLLVINLRNGAAAGCCCGSSSSLLLPDSVKPAVIDGKAKHSPTNDWDTNAVWVDARRAMTVTQERHTEPQDKTLSQTDCHTS